MASKYRIYKISANGMVYIGLTKSSVKTRWVQHRASAKKGSPSLLHAAIRELGENAFSIEEICSCTSKENACTVEQMFIKEYRSMHPYGYNMTTGGECGSTWNQESCASQAKKITAYFDENPEARDAISSQVSNSWKNPAMRAQYVESAKKRSSSPEQRASLAARAAKGRANRWAAYRANQVTA